MLILRDIDNKDIVSRDETNLSTVNWTYDPGSIHSFALSSVNASDDSFNLLRNNSNQTEIVKLNSSGVFQWGSGFLAGSSIGTVAVVDQNDESYQGLGGRESCRKIDASGSQVWENNDASGAGDNRIRNVDLDNQGFLYAPSWDESKVRKINTSTGVTARTDTPAGSNRVDHIVCEPDGTYYVSDSTNSDTIKVDSDGVVVWTKTDAHVSSLDADFIYMLDGTTTTDILKVNKSTGATIATFTGPSAWDGRGAANGQGSLFQAFGPTGPHIIKEISTSTFLELQTETATAREEPTAVSPGRYGAGFHLTTTFNMHVGSNVVNVMNIGSTNVTKAYKGSTLVFED